MCTKCSSRAGLRLRCDQGAGDVWRLCSGQGTLRMNLANIPSTL